MACSDTCETMKCQLVCGSISEHENIYKLLSLTKKAANVKMKVAYAKVNVQTVACVKVQVVVVKVKVQAAAIVKVA